MRISTVLRQWCPECARATVTRQCIYPPGLYCAECCPPGRPDCEDYDDEED